MGLTEPMWVQFIKGLTSLLIAIHSWIIQPRPATSHARLASSRLSSRFFPRSSTSSDLLLDGFSRPKQIHLYLDSNLKGPPPLDLLLVAVHAGALTYLPQSPKLLCSFVGDVQISRTIAFSASNFCWFLSGGFKKLRQKSSGATKSIYTAFVAAQRPGVAPSVWFQLFLQLSICSLSVSLSFLFLLYVSF